MTRRFALVTAAVTCLVLLAGSFARAAQDPLAVIPEESLGLVLVNRLAETDAKIQAFGRQMQLEVPSPLSMFKAKAGLEGVLDEKGTAAIALLPAGDAPSRPVAVLFLPVTDYKQFVGKLNVDDASAEIVEAQVGNQSFVIGNRGGFAVVAKKDNRRVLERALGSSKGMAADLAPLRDMLADGDVAGVVTRRGVELLSAKGQEALQQVRKVFSGLPEDQKQGMEAAIEVFKVYEKILESLGQEINSYAIAGRIDDGGNLHLIERVRMTPGGAAAKMLSEVKAPQRDPLAGLPGGPFVFALGGTLPESLGECMMQLSADVMKAAPGLYGLKEQQVDKLIEISRQSMKGIRGMSMVMGVGKPGDPIYSNIAVVELVDDSKAFWAEYQKTIEAMNELLKETEGSILTAIELEQVKIGDVPALRLAMKIPLVPNGASFPGYDQMMEKLFGPGGKIVAFLAAADDHTIVAAYTQKKLLRQMLKAAEGTSPGLAGDPQLAKTAAMLPPGALWILYVSPKGAIDFTKRLIPVFTPEGKTAPKLPDFPETPPIGIAVKTAPDGLSSHTVVPAAVVKGIGQFVAEIKKTVQADASEVKTQAVEAQQR